jgi:hypothetical protein
MKLTRYGVLTVTEDTANSVDLLMRKCKEYKKDFYFEQPKVQSLPELSLVPAGRELWFNLLPPDKRDFLDKTYVDALYTLWSLAVPCGFTPHLRNPIPEDLIKTQTFYYLGHWQFLYDRLISEGRGDCAWPSVCCAAQCESQSWKGDRLVERSIQSHLHRVGINCGPVDGKIGPRTVEAIKLCGLAGMDLNAMLLLLEKKEIRKAITHDRIIGNIVIPNKELVIHSFGRVKHTLNANGATIIVEGNGRLIVDIK